MKGRLVPQWFSHPAVVAPVAEVACGAPREMKVDVDVEGLRWGEAVAEVLEVEVEVEVEVERWV